MKKLYDDLSFMMSKKTTQKYSTSFSLGILALAPHLRTSIYAIYGYVRLADEIVDSFQGYNKKELLDRFKEDTKLALSEKISINPLIHSFQETIHKYKIDYSLIYQFLHSMEMDLYKIDYNSDLYKKYILGSAEVVGLMCLKIFVEGDETKYEELKPYAMKLGSAFQKVNFLRDLKDDFQILGRTYFPNIELLDFNDYTKKIIEDEIQKEFDEALIGIMKLPTSSKFGVYLAYKYYLSLFHKIQKTPAKKVLNQRVRIPNGKKISLAMSSYVQYKIAM